MPRNPIITEVQAEELATNSPVRRSSRLVSGSTSAGANITGTTAASEGDNKPVRTTRTRRLSTQSNESTDSQVTQSKNASNSGTSKPATRTRRSSITSDISETEPAKTVKTRRSSVSKNEEAEDQAKPKTRGRRGSNASEHEVEVPKIPARASTRRRSSVTDDVADEIAGTPAKRNTRARKLSEDEEVKKPATRGRRRSLTADEEDEAKETATKSKRGRRSSIDHVETPKTPARVTRRNSTGTNESNTINLEDELKEVTVKITPLKKRKLVEKVEAELDLSIINESAGDLNVSDPTTPKTSPITSKEVEFSPRRSPRINAPKHSPGLNDSINENIEKLGSEKKLNSSKDSNSSDKENVNTEINAQSAGAHVQKSVLIGRVSNVFKPNQKECSFAEEPMDVDISLSAIAPDNSIMEKIPAATNSVILSGNAPNIPTTNDTIENSEEAPSLLNNTLSSSSTQVPDQTGDAFSLTLIDADDDDDDLLIEETENTVDISFKKIADTPDASLVINNPLTKVKVVLSGKSSSPINSNHRILSRKSKSPIEGTLSTNIEEQEDPGKLTVTSGSRRSKSKSKSLSPTQKDYVSNDDSKTASKSPRRSLQFTENTTQTDNKNELLQEAPQEETPVKGSETEKNQSFSSESHLEDQKAPKVETPLKSGETEKNRSFLSESHCERQDAPKAGPPLNDGETRKNKSFSSVGHFEDQDNDYEEILVVNEEVVSISLNTLSSGNNDGQGENLMLSESTHYDFDLSSDGGETSGGDENAKEANHAVVSVCSQEDTVDLNLISKENLEQDLEATEPRIDLSSQDDLPRDEKGNINSREPAENVEHVECSIPIESQSALEIVENKEVEKKENWQSKNFVEETSERMEATNIIHSSASESQSALEIVENEEVEKKENWQSKNLVEETSEKMEATNIFHSSASGTRDKVVHVENERQQTLTEKKVDIPKRLQSKLKLDEFASAKVTEYVKSKNEDLDEDSSKSEAETDKSEEEYNDFIDGMAEECEEDTPSEDSNQIIDEGESIGSSDSDQNTCEDDDYDPDDSFICDDEQPVLLSGDEYDLSDEKKEKSAKKGSRIIDCKSLNVDNGIVTVPKKNGPDRAKPKKSRIIRIEDSSSEEEEEEKEKEKGVSVIVLDDTKQSSLSLPTTTKDSVIVIDDELEQPVEPPTDNRLKIEENKESWQNVSLLQNISLNALNASTQKRSRKTSLTLQENIQLDGCNDPVLSQRINSLVQSFCSTIKKGEISLNLSLEYEDLQAVPPKESEEKTEAVHILSEVTLVTEGKPKLHENDKSPQVETDTSPIENENMDVDNANMDVKNDKQIDELNKIELENEVFEEEISQKIEANHISSTSEGVSKNRRKLKRRLSKSLSEIEVESKKSKRRKNNRRYRADSCSPGEESLKAGTINLMEQLVTDVKNRPRRIIKPSTSVAEGTWNVSPVSSLKPSTSSATRPKPHPKDFRNQLLNDPRRVRRIETKKLLKKKGFY